MAWRGDHRCRCGTPAGGSTGIDARAGRGSTGGAVGEAAGTSLGGRGGGRWRTELGVGWAGATAGGVAAWGWRGRWKELREKQTWQWLRAHGHPYSSALGVVGVCPAAVCRDQGDRGPRSICRVGEGRCTAVSGRCSRLERPAKAGRVGGGGGGGGGRRGWAGGRGGGQSGRPRDGGRRRKPRRPLARRRRGGGRRRARRRCRSR
jgi:hypothetical protein